MASFADRKMKYVLVIPVVIFVLCLAIFPLVFSIYISFGQWLPGTAGIQFTGIRNYQLLFSDPRFINALRLSFIYVASAVALQLTIGIVLAMFLQKDLSGKNFFRVSFMLPMLLSPVAVSYAWKMIYDYSRGPLNFFIGLAGIEPIEWVGRSTTAVLSLVIVDVWQWTPFMVLTILAAFEALPEELFEAAVVDGGTPFTIFRVIALPLALPVIVTIVFLRVIDAFKVFDTVYILTGGGPGTASEMLNFYIYVKGFRAFDLGYGSAMSWVQLAIIIALFTFFIKSLKRMGAMR